MPFPLSNSLLERHWPQKGPLPHHHSGAHLTTRIFSKSARHHSLLGRLLFGTSFFSENGGSMAVVLATIYGWKPRLMLKDHIRTQDVSWLVEATKPWWFGLFGGRKKRPKKNRSDNSTEKKKAPIC